MSGGRPHRSEARKLRAATGREPPQSETDPLACGVGSTDADQDALWSTCTLRWSMRAQAAARRGQVLLNLGEPGGVDISPWANRVRLISRRPPMRPSETRAIAGTSAVLSTRSRRCSGRRRAAGRRRRRVRRPRAGGGARRPRSPSARCRCARASAIAACHAVPFHSAADRSATARCSRASSRSPASAQATAAGTASMTLQKVQASSWPRAAVAWSTTARALSTSGAARIIVPYTRCSRCSAIADQRASGSARCSSRRGLGAVALREAHLGEPLQAVGLPRGGADVVVQLGGLGELGLGEGEVAGEQRGLAAQRGGERDRPQHAGSPRRVAQRGGERRAPPRTAWARRAGTPPRTGGCRTSTAPGPAVAHRRAARRRAGRTTPRAGARPGPAGRSGRTSASRRGRPPRGGGAPRPRRPRPLAGHRSGRPGSRAGAAARRRRRIRPAPARRAPRPRWRSRRRTWRPGPAAAAAAAARPGRRWRRAPPGRRGRRRRPRWPSACPPAGRAAARAPGRGRRGAPSRSARARRGMRRWPRRRGRPAAGTARRRRRRRPAAAGGRSAPGTRRGRAAPRRPRRCSGSSRCGGRPSSRASRTSECRKR